MDRGKSADSGVLPKKDVKMLGYILVAVCILLGTTAQIILKTGMNEVGKLESFQQMLSLEHLMGMLTNKFVLIGFMFYGVASILWLGALSRMNVSMLYPLLSIGYVLTAVGGHYLLGEPMPGIRWFGLMLIIGGVFLITR